MEGPADLADADGRADHGDVLVDDGRMRVVADADDARSGRRDREQMVELELADGSDGPEVDDERGARSVLEDAGGPRRVVGHDPIGREGRAPYRPTETASAIVAV